MKEDLHHDINAVVALNFQEITSSTTTVGNIIDTFGYHGIEFVPFTGTVTDGDYALVLEYGDDPALADAAAVPADYLLGTLAEASFTEDTDDNKSRRIGYVGKKRYVRPSVTSSSVSSGAFVGVLGILYLPNEAPTAADA